MEGDRKNPETIKKRKETIETETNVSVRKDAPVGILRVDSGPKSRRNQLYQGEPPSPQPSIDRLSVTFAEESVRSDSSTRCNLYIPRSLSPNMDKVHFPEAATGKDSDEEDYSASVNAIIQRRASQRRSKRRSRRASSPFSPDILPGTETGRRRSSVFTTSSGDTAITMDDSLAAEMTQEQIFENIRLHKEVLSNVKMQPWNMRKKLKLVTQAKAYVKRHEGELQERFIQSHSIKSILARWNIYLIKKWHYSRREMANLSNWLIPWERRIKAIESHFGSVVASYFIFLRWLFWVNVVTSAILIAFVAIPEIITTRTASESGRKQSLAEDKYNSTNFLTIWDFEGVLKYTPLFYGWYSNKDFKAGGYRVPLAYFMTELVVYVYSFVATLRKMAENSRMSKLSEKEDECIFTWKIFTGWDYMIGNPETAHNRVMSVVMGFKEALLEEAEKKRKDRNWKVIWTRVFVNMTVLGLFALSAAAVVVVVKRSTEPEANSDIWRRNETTVVMTLISFLFPMLLEFLGFMEQYHPRKQLRIQLARIMLLNLLNLYSLIFAQFDKINDMSEVLVKLKPNVTPIPVDVVSTSESVLVTESTELSGITLSRCSRVCYNVTDFSLDEMVASVAATVATTVLPKFKTTLGNLSNGSFKEEVASSWSGLFSTWSPLGNLSSVDDSWNEFNVSSTTTAWNLFPDQFSNSSDPFLGSSDKLINSSWAQSLNSSSAELLNSSSNEFSSKFVDSAHAKLSSPLKLFNTRNFSETELYSWNSTFLNASDYEEVSSNWLVDKFQDYLTFILSKFEASNSSLNSRGNYNETNFDLTTILDEPTTYEYFKTTLDPSNSLPDERFETELSEMYGELTTALVTTTKSRTRIKCQNICDPLPTYVPAPAYDILDMSTAGSYQARTELRRLCWETMFGQELVKLTVMDFVFTVAGIIGIDFIRGIFIRVMNRCWCWDLEKKFPEYGEFKVAENILHLVNNQGMVWMGMFFSPGLVVINVFKLLVLMYLRSWAVLTCNIPHSVIFRASRSNNFYFALLLTMLFLCVLPVGYAIVWVEPSWHCGPFSNYYRIYDILTKTVRKNIPKWLEHSLDYVVSPGIVIPLLVLLILVIYYLISLTNSLREANTDLKIQLRQERTEERRKMFKIASRRRRVGSGGSGDLENTPFAKWKKLLSSLPAGKSIDDNSKATTPTAPPAIQQNGSVKPEVNKTRDLVSKFIRRAMRKPSVTSDEQDDATDTEQPESLPEDVISLKEAKAQVKPGPIRKLDLQRASSDSNEGKHVQIAATSPEVYRKRRDTFELKRKQRNYSPTRSGSSTRHDSITSNWSDNIPVITISKTQSSEDILEQEPEGVGQEQGNSKEQVMASSSSDTLVAEETFKPKIKHVLQKQTGVTECSATSPDESIKDKLLRTMGFGYGRSSNANTESSDVQDGSSNDQNGSLNNQDGSSNDQDGSLNIQDGSFILDDGRSITQDGSLKLGESDKDESSGVTEESEEDSTKMTVKVFEKSSTSGNSGDSKTEGSSDYKDKSLS